VTSLPSETEAATSGGFYLDELCDLARRLMNGHRRRLLGLAGPPGSGKSTLAARMADALGSRTVVVPADGFHLANRVLAALGLADRKGAPETFDTAGLQCLLQRLRNQAEEVIYAPEFARRIEEPIAGAIAIPRSVPLVIVEGNYLTLEHGRWRGTADLLDEIWYLDVSTAVRQSRLVRRHRSFGRSYEEARRWAFGSDERNARIIEPTRGRADRIIPNSGGDRAHRDL
jgi:pantothenate kinase